MKKYQTTFTSKSIIKDQSLLRHEDIKKKIHLLSELRSFIPPLQPEEYAQLENNIVRNGCREALIIWSTTEAIGLNNESTAPIHILVDGHNRYSICQKHQIDFKIQLEHFSSFSEVRDFMIDNQLGRRNLTSEQAAYLRGLRYLSEKKERGRYDRLPHKGQNVPYAGPTISEDATSEHKGQNVPYAEPTISEDTTSEHKGQNVPYAGPTISEDTTSEHKGQNVPYAESTATKLAKQYNVNEKTIKRDAEFTKGMEMLDPALKISILSGQVKVSKIIIQQLAKSNSSNALPKIKSVEELYSLAQNNVTSKTEVTIRDRMRLTEQLSGLLDELKQLSEPHSIRALCVRIISCAKQLKELN